MSLQEKFQVITPPNANDDAENQQWIFPVVGNSKVREIGDTGHYHKNNRTSDEFSPQKLNFLPPGMDISEQCNVQIEQMPFNMGESDVSNDVGLEAFKNGFTRKPMKGADDVYTGEHIDHFYGEAIDEEGKEGFAERNNYLDRI